MEQNERAGARGDAEAQSHSIGSTALAKARRRRHARRSRPTTRSKSCAPAPEQHHVTLTCETSPRPGRPSRRVPSTPSSSTRCGTPIEAVRGGTSASQTPRAARSRSPSRGTTPGPRTTTSGTTGPGWRSTCKMKAWASSRRRGRIACSNAPTSGTPLGSGIGLAVARNVVEELGGTITISTRKDRGVISRPGACVHAMMPVPQSTDQEIGGERGS